MDPKSEAHLELARWLGGVNAFVTAINKPASLRELLDLVTATACDLLGFDFCGVLLVQPEQRRLLMRGAHGFSTDYVAQLNDQVPLSLATDGQSESPSARAFLSARPVVVNDVLADPLMKPWQSLAKQQGYRSIVSVPLLLKGRPFGVLNGYSAKHHGISESSVDLLSILANQVATAIESIHLRDEQRENIERLAQANESLRRQSQLLEQAHEVHKRLNDLALGAGGLEEICAALEGLLSRPVVIEDVHGRCLAPLDGPPPDFPLLEPDTIRDMSADVTEVSAVAGGRPEVLTVAPVRVTGELAARIWVAARLDELSDLDRRALESATVIVALELMRLRAAQEVEWRVQGDLVDALLQGDPREFPQLVTRARALGHDLEVPHHIILVSLPTESAPSAQGAMSRDAFTRAMKRTVASFLDTSGIQPFITVHDGRVVILIPDEDPDRLRSLMERMHQRIALRHGVSTLAIIGPTSAQPEAYARSLRITRGAALLQESHGFSAGIVSLNDLGIASLLLQVDSPDELAGFASRTMGGLIEYDLAKSSALEETLRAYFMNGCNVGDTASVLFVHPNTVKLRLRKIESLLDRDLSDPEDVLNLRAAVLISDIISPPSRRL